tara:strand:- start:2254 stop:2442 length:189 start_codon:yes stop_codon:yes gene_type:complete
MASVENQLLLISYITLAAVIAMIYGMRRIFHLERKIIRMEQAILGKKRSGAKKKSGKKKKRR